MTDRRRIPDPEPVLRALPAGAAVIYRDDDDPRRQSLARRYRTICAGRGVLFLVAGDAGLAAAVGADGVHQRAGDAGRPGAGSPAAPPRLAPPLILTVSAHGAAGLSQAAAMGAHLALLSPVFPTRSHPGAEHLGIARFRALAAASPTPVLALGGVDEENARRLQGANVAGLAAIGAFRAA